jgi:putative glutamine amidotransferase
MLRKTAGVRSVERVASPASFAAVLEKKRADEYARTGTQFRLDRSKAPLLEFQTARVGGHDVLLPKNVSFSRYARLTGLEQVHVGATAPLKHDARPLVGVLISETSFFSKQDSRSAQALIAKVQALGCRVVLIPPRLDLVMPKNGAKALVEQLDGLIGPGGADVDPRIYGQLNRFAISTNYRRDRFEADVAIAALNRELYMLGVCRSHQLWNAATGGALVQDVQKEGLASLGQDQDHFGLPEDAPFVVRNEQGEIIFENRVDLDGDCSLREAAQEDNILTNSFHHQAVEKPGGQFRVTGTVLDRRTGRRTVEACESANAITVQWHPELAGDWSSADRALIELFVRRVSVFRMVRAIREGGDRPNVERVLQLCGERGVALTAADNTWVRRELPKLID